jgi:glycerophosphoryl diester phosphodiesterase
MVPMLQTVATMRTGLRLVSLALVAAAVACAPTDEGDDSDSTASQLTTTYWQGVTRSLATSPYGNRAAISCHNCYAQTVGTTAAALAAIDTGLERNADIIGLDVTQHNDGILYVEHDDSHTVTTRPRFLTLINYAPLRTSNRLLSIEIKEAYNAATASAFCRGLLNELWIAGYPSNGRPVLIHAFDDGRDQFLDVLRGLLATDPLFIGMRPNIKLYLLVRQNNSAGQGFVQGKVDTVIARGFHGIDFEYRQRNLFAGLSYARQRGIGADVWTIPAQFGEVFIAALRDEVDTITTDFPQNQAREVVQAANGLIYLNAANQSGAGNVVRYNRTTTATFTAPVNTSGAPAFENIVATNEDRFGGSLVFSGAQSLRFYDADNVASQGYFVTALVNFDDLTLAVGETSSILAKTDSGAFGLELYNPGGLLGSVLRFGVRVGGQYRYATFPTAGLNGTDSYFIIGAYDGGGGVRIWVNGVQGTSESTSGGVQQNDVPVLLGADPQGATGSRFFFAGKIQQALVQTWGPH